MFQIDYWRQAKATGVPADRPLPELITELGEALRSPDAIIRDELAFDILSDWVIDGTCDEHLLELGDRMAAILHIGLGESGTDSVFGRAFAALILGAIVERDITLQKFTPIRWYAASRLWFTAEQDLRGVVDCERGVAHTVAHGADLIASLARHPAIGQAEAVALLGDIPARLANSSGFALQLSEDDRLAYAAMSLLHRPDITAADLAAAMAPVIALTKVERRVDLDPIAHARINSLNWLRALFLQLQFGVKTMPWYAADGHFATPPPDKDAKLTVLRDGLHEFSFWFA